MQKVVAILEQHVQWIAIGLGALFALWMAYAYFIVGPAAVTIGSETLTASQVDEFTQTHVASELEAKIISNESITISPPQHVDKFKSEMAWTNAAPLNLAGKWDSQVLDVTPPGVPTPPGQDPTQVQKTPGGVAPLVPPGGDATKVSELPKLPTATPAESKFGRSVVVVPTPGQPVAQPVAVVPGQSLGVDRDWVTQLFKIEMKGIDDEFNRTKIPAAFRKTLFLQVEMQRVEVDADGKEKTGTEKILPAIAAWRNQGQPPPPFPDEANPRPLAPTYLQWASTNVADILQPLYYQVEKGDLWAKPGQLVNPLALFDPGTFKGDLNSLAPEQRKQVMDARKEQSRLKAEQDKANRPVRQPRAPGGPARGEGGGAIGDGVNYAPAPPRGQPPRQPVAPYRGVGGLGGAGMEGGMEGGAMYPGAGGYAAPVAAGLPQPGTDYPAAEFDPKDWNTKTVETWAHDDSIESGKTYRYRVRYKIRNPIFGAGNVANPDTLADKFALVSDWSAWSKDVAIPQMVNFFVATSKSPNSNTVSFDVFRWHEGAQKKQAFPVSPGDQIGGKKDNVDFSTGWTVVDFRPDPRTGDTQILLMNDDGKLISRSFSADQGDQLYRGLKDAVEQAKQLAGGPVAAGNGGLVGK